MTKGIANYKIGDSFNGFMLIREARKGIASNGKPFLTLIFQDKTGEIEAKLWEASKEDEETFTTETIVKLSGMISEFRGKAQFRINQIRPAVATDGYTLADFLEQAPVKKEALYEKIMEAVFAMENSNIQRIVRAFINKYKDELLQYPAAIRNHHAYVSGLAHHIVSMLKIAKELYNLYPEINRDLLYAGIILHDLGKMNELSNVTAPTYTIEGKLLGHIPIMVTEIEQVANDLNIEGEEVLILKHLVLSHHGKAEWGSPKPPLVREAELLHLIDLIDARMNILNKALAHVEPGEFSDRLFPMDNRSFYKPTFEE